MAEATVSETPPPSLPPSLAPVRNAIIRARSGLALHFRGTQPSLQDTPFTPGVALYFRGKQTVLKGLPTTAAARASGSAPVRYAIHSFTHPWVATGLHGYTASIEGAGCNSAAATQILRLGIYKRYWYIYDISYRVCLCGYTRTVQLATAHAAIS